MKALIFISLFISSLFSHYNVPSSVKRFIPNGYEVLNFTKGNLNRDGIDDAILILKVINEDNSMGDSPKRSLYILIGNGNGGYKLATKNSKCVLGVKDGGMIGDPFSAVAIKNGYFSIEHYGGSSWRWIKITTFRYDSDRDNWFLHREGDESYHSSNPRKIKRKMRTKRDFGIVPFTRYNIFRNF